MKISEIFESIQGESKYTGYLTTFIRLFGCSAKCYWCDTKYSYTDNSSVLSLNDILKKIAHYKNRYVCITGGEPLEQKSDVMDLIYSLKKKFDANISLETNGFHSIENIPKFVHIVMDYKLPSAKINFNTNHFRQLKKNDELKIVIAKESDYFHFLDLVKDFEEVLPKENIVISPTSDMVNFVLNKFIADQLNYKLGVQLHKYIEAK